MSSASNVVKRCVLRSRNYKHRDIELPNQTPVQVGRGPQTRIRDRRCSKVQVEITADYSLQKAVVLQLGSNPSEVDCKLLVTYDSVEVHNGCSINLIKDDLKYTLEFLDGCSSHSKHKHHSSSSPTASVKKLKSVSETSSRSDPNSSAPNDFGLSNEFPDSLTSANAVCDEKPLSDEELGRKDIESQLNAMHKSVVDDLKSLSTEDSWEEYDHSKILIFTPAGARGRAKVAAFDLDHTIITTKTGKVFPVDTNDWTILYPEIPGKLKELNANGYKIVLFTNQKGISRGKTSVHEFKKKVQKIIHRLGVPIQAMVSTGSGKYRKPNTGMWDYFVQRCNQDVAVDLDSSLYVGDAAGRPEKWAPKKKKDFSCADRLFALNIGIKFFTPEEFFLGQKPAPFKMPIFDPRKLGTLPLAIKCQPLPEEVLSPDSLTSASSEVVVFVGFPAAGKSHFVQTYLIPKGYVHVNRDTLGSWQKCVAVCSKSLGEKQKVVIDNTNPDPESRMRFIECAKKFQVPCRCFLFTCSLEQAKHNNVFRELQNPDEKHVGVNDMVLNSYKSKYKEPSLSEGFTCIVKINFIPKFKSKHEEKLFKKFLIEK